MNQILVVRFSNNRGYNAKLRDALAGTFDPSCTPAYPMPMGGFISVLVTNKSYEEIVQIVKDADCGETVQVTDCSMPTFSEVIISEAHVGELPEEGIQAEISRLMAKQGDVGLTEAEANLLTRLLESDPR